MPYITQNERDKIDNVIDSLITEINKTSDENLSGVLNYTMTRIISASMKNNVRYNKINNLIGVLECVKMELYRRVAAPYEDKKIDCNGDVKETIKLI